MLLTKFSQFVCLQLYGLVPVSWEIHVVSASDSILTEWADCFLHFRLKGSQPELNIALTADGHVQIDEFRILSHVLNDSFDNFNIRPFFLSIFSEFDSSNGIEHFLEIFLDGIWVTSHGEDL